MHRHIHNSYLRCAGASELRRAVRVLGQHRKLMEETGTGQPTRHKRGQLKTHQRLAGVEGAGDCATVTCQDAKADVQIQLVQCDTQTHSGGGVETCTQQCFARANRDKADITRPPHTRNTSRRKGSITAPPDLITSAMRSHRIMMPVNSVSLLTPVGCQGSHSMQMKHCELQRGKHRQPHRS